jgi:hypothetical protein
MIDEAPLFLANDRVVFREFIKKKVCRKPTKDIFSIVDNGKLKPSKALQDAFGEVLNGNHEFVLVMGKMMIFYFAFVLCNKILSTSPGTYNHIGFRLIRSRCMQESHHFLIA